MRTQFLWCLYFLFPLSIFSQKPSHPTEAVPANPGLTDSLDLYFEKLVALEQFNGVVLVEKEGQTLYRKAWNISGQSLPTLPVTEESQFDLRSISKLFAKASIIHLEEQGKCKRTDQVSQYLPDFPRGEEITLDHLMHNQSGLPREFTQGPENLLALTPDEILELAKKEPLEFDPGTDERYSNIGFQVLYRIISEISGKSYSQFLHDTFFVPLDMTASGGHFFTDHPNLLRYAHGHYVDGEGTWKAVLAFEPDEFRVGHLYADVDDLSRFMHHLHQEPFSTALAAEGAITHAGGTRGKRAWVYHQLEKNYTLVFLANFDGIPFQQLTQDLIALVEGRPVEMPAAVNRTAIQLPTPILEQYAGVFDFVEADHLILEFKVEKDTLFLYQNGENGGALLPETETRFFFDPTSKESLTFEKNTAGEWEAWLDFQGVTWKGIRQEK